MAAELTFYELSPDGETDPDTSALTGNYADASEPTKKRKTHLERLKARLWNGDWVSAGELQQLSSHRFGARISDLREKENMVIVCRETESGLSEYCYLGPRNEKTLQWAREFDPHYGEHNKPKTDTRFELSEDDRKDLLVALYHCKMTAPEGFHDGLRDLAKRLSMATPGFNPAENF